ARILPFNTLRILCKGDTHVHVEAWWAVANKIRPINIGPEQPSSCVQGCSGSYLRHAFSLARHTASNKRTHMPRTAPLASAGTGNVRPVGHFLLRGWNGTPSWASGSSAPGDACLPGRAAR